MNNEYIVKDARAYGHASQTDLDSIKDELLVDAFKALSQKVVPGKNYQIELGVGCSSEAFTGYESAYYVVSVILEFKEHTEPDNAGVAALSALDKEVDRIVREMGDCPTNTETYNRKLGILRELITSRLDYVNSIGSMPAE